MQLPVIVGGVPVDLVDLPKAQSIPQHDTNITDALSVGSTTSAASIEG